MHADKESRIAGGRATKTRRCMRSEVSSGAMIKEGARRGLRFDGEVEPIAQLFAPPRPGGGGVTRCSNPRRKRALSRNERYDRQFPPESLPCKASLTA